MTEETIYINKCNWIDPTTVENVDFAPVIVEKGRKWKGRGFIVAVLTSSGACGWRHTGFGWEPNTYETETAKIWIPSEKKFGYANAKYAENDPSITKQEIDLARAEYVKQTIIDTINWCKSKQPNATDKQNLMFARRVLLKNHPEMQAAIDATIPDTRNLNDEIESTIQWVMNLPQKHSRPKMIEIARKALTKKGLIDKEGFEACFNICCELHGLLRKAV